MSIQTAAGGTTGHFLFASATNATVYGNESVFNYLGSASAGLSTNGIPINSLYSKLTTVNSIVIGDSTSGSVSQALNSIAIGYQAGMTSQGILANGNTGYAIAIGYNAGSSGQGAFSVAMGQAAGQINQGANSFALGAAAGYNSQGTNSVGIGQNAGNLNQGAFSFALGGNAGQNNQGGATGYSIAIGFNAGNTSQGGGSVAIGATAGNSSQGVQTVAIGGGAGQISQNYNSVAIGYQAGNNTQRNSSVAIGYQAGYTNQKDNSVAIGYQAGYSAQGVNSFALGQLSGQINQGDGAVGIGAGAGGNNQGFCSLSFGVNAGKTGQGYNSVAIGNQAAYANQGATSIAIGYQAGYGSTTTSGQVANSIILNATGAALTSGTSGTFIAPIRLTGTSPTTYIFYDPTLKEVFYNTSPSDARLKTDISGTKLGLNFINALNPVEFRWKDKDICYLYDENGNPATGSNPGKRFHQGFIAQEVKAALDSVGADSAIFMNISDGQIETNGLNAIRHVELIAPIVKAIQEQNTIIQQLQQQVAALQQQINPSSGSSS